MVLECVNAIKDIEATRLHCKSVENLSIIQKIIFTQSPKFVQVSKAIIHSILSAKWSGCLAYHIITNHQYSPWFASSAGMELIFSILQHFTNTSCQQKLSSKDTENIFGNICNRTSLFEEHDEHYVQCLLLLVGQQQETFTSKLKKSSHLDILMQRYYVSTRLCILFQQLICVLYKSIKDCLKSKDLLKCLLYLSGKPSTISHLTKKDSDELRKFFLKKMKKNYLNRSILLLAVILVDNIAVLKCLPKAIAMKYIDTQDAHGSKPLHLAEMHHNKSAITFLIRHGAKQNSEDFFGLVPHELGHRVNVISKGSKLENKLYLEQLNNSTSTNCDGSQRLLRSDTQPSLGMSNCL